jgi:hypothetical protein
VNEVNPEIQQRFYSSGCLLSLFMLVTGGIAAFLGHPKYLLPAVPVVLLWFIYARVQRKAGRRWEQEAFETAFRDFDGSAPVFKSEPAMGWPSFTLTFDSQETLERAEAQGRISTFKAEIQKLYGHIGRGERFDVDRAVFATYEGRFNFDHLERQFPHLAGRRAQLLARRSVTIWSQINYWATVVVQIGMALGTIALVFLGREFTKDELGIFAWPLTILWLLSFFYVVTYLVFTETSIWVRVLWLITLTLFLLGLAAAPFNANQHPGQPPASTADGSSSTPSP